MLRARQKSELRDKGKEAIESALMRPQMAAYYEDADLAKQAALVILGLAQAHPFVDGNKRIALAGGTVLLHLNGYFVQSKGIEFGIKIVEALTDHDNATAVQDRLAEWIRSRLLPLSK